DELDGKIEPLHVGGDLRSASVHDDRVQPDVLQQHHIARELLAEGRVLHRRAPVLDYHRLAVKLSDIGARLEESPDVSHVVYSALILTYSCERSEKKISVSVPSPGSASSNSISRARTARASAVWS